ncbi:hypothetical protein [Psychrobacter nivimaris]|uniref:hypothetical protein n=1 Tax=Psychrobacter nivimaris TaxID=281738 RepID=UPI001918CD01|nr:hypothetical protein [Psychrobacter nivimaris]
MLVIKLNYLCKLIKNSMGQILKKIVIPNNYFNKDIENHSSPGEQDIAFEEKKYIYNEITTELYSDGVDITNYENKLDYIFNSLSEKVVNGSATAFDKLSYFTLISDTESIEVIINNLIVSYIDEVKTLIKIESVRNRYFGILNNLQVLFPYVNRIATHFMNTKGILIKVNDFYRLFDICLKYKNSKKMLMKDEDILKCESHLSIIYTNYTVYESTFGDIVHHNKHMKKNYQSFGSRKLYILTTMSIRAYYTEDCEYAQLANYELLKAKERLKSEINVSDLYNALKISNLLYIDNSELCNIFYSRYNFFYSRMTQFELSEVYNMVSENEEFYHKTMDLIHSHISKESTHTSIAFRLNKIYVDNLIKYGLTDKAKKEFKLFINRFECDSTFRAINYIATLERLGMLVEREDLFNIWYDKFIFSRFLGDKISIANIVPLVTMQYKISQINNLKALKEVYFKFLKNKINIKNSKRLIVINPLHDLNTMYAPLHLYRNLIQNHSVPILNLSCGQIDFFNERELILGNQNIPLLNFDNMSVINQPKHWNNDFSDWRVDIDKKIIECNGTNLYQSFFETIARNQKVYTFDWSSASSLYYFQLFKRRIDRNAYVYKELLNQLNNSSIVFLANMHHYAPWAYYYHRSLQLNRPERESLVQVTAAYENYSVDLKTLTYNTMTALNLTKHKNSRSAVFGSSENFYTWARSEVENISNEFIESYVEEYRRKVNETIEREGISDSLLEAIKQAKKNNKTIVCILGKRLCDLCVPEMKGVFPNMKAWANATNQFVLQNDDIFMIVKPHPHEIKYEISMVELESFLDWFSDEDGIYKLGHRECGLDELIPYVDCFLMWNGTSTVNLAKQKANVIVCDDWANKDYPIDLYQPASKESYYDDIKKSKNWDESSEAVIYRAKLAYLYTKNLENADFSVKNIGIVRSSTNVNWNVPYVKLGALEKEFMTPEESYEDMVNRVFET